MYARLLMFMTEPGKAEATQELVTKLDNVFKTRKGFRGVTYFADEVLGEFGALVLWETAEDAASARSVVFSKVKKGAKSLLKGPLLFQLFKVVEQRPEHARPAVVTPSKTALVSS